MTPERARQIRQMVRYARHNTANRKTPHNQGLTDRRVIAQLVRRFGRNAEAEERIVEELCRLQPPPRYPGYVNTDLMRHLIRRAQGRRRKEREPDAG